MIKRVFDAVGLVGQWLAWSAMSLLGLLVLLVTLDVVMRNIGFKPLAWIPDAAEYILLYAAFLPAGALVRSKGHVFVEFIREALPAGAKRLLERGVYLACAVICAYLAWVASVHFFAVIRSGAYDTRAFDMPRWLVFLPMALGLWLASLEWLRFLCGHDSMYVIDPLKMDGY